jgi:hypothetical protein
MQMPKPNKFHKKLEALVGDWAGDETMHPTPWEPQGGTAKGSYKVRPAFDGFGVVQDYMQKRGGKTSYRGHGVMGYDTQNNCYVWHWSDTMGGVATSVTTGKWERNKLTFQHAGPMAHVRYTYTFHRDGTVGFSIENSDDGQAWQPFMEGRYTKKGG